MPKVREVAGINKRQSKIENEKVGLLVKFKLLTKTPRDLYSISLYINSAVYQIIYP